MEKRYTAHIVVKSGISGLCIYSFPVYLIIHFALLQEKPRMLNKRPVRNQTDSVFSNNNRWVLGQMQKLVVVRYNMSKQLLLLTSQCSNGQ